MLFVPIDLSEQILIEITESFDMTFSNLIYFLKPRINEITNTRTHSLLTLAIFSAIWTASSIFEALRTILNKSNRVSEPPSYLFRRLISIIEFITMIFLTIIIMLFLSSIPSLILKIIRTFNIKGSNYYFYVIKNTSFLRIVSITCYSFFWLVCLYYFLPNKKQKIMQIIPGAILVIFFWHCFTNLFKYYIVTSSQLSAIYGSIVGVIIALLYFYFCSIIFVLGAEFNYNLFNSVNEL